MEPYCFTIMRPPECSCRTTLRLHTRRRRHWRKAAPLMSRRATRTRERRRRLASRSASKRSLVESNDRVRLCSDDMTLGSSVAAAAHAKASPSSARSYLDDSLHMENLALNQKLNYTMNSIRTFWSPELKHERQQRKEETMRLAAFEEKVIQQAVRGAARHSGERLQTIERQLCFFFCRTKLSRFDANLIAAKKTLANCWRPTSFPTWNTSCAAFESNSAPNRRRTRAAPPLNIRCRRHTLSIRTRRQPPPPPRRLTSTIILRRRLRCTSQSRFAIIQTKCSTRKNSTISKREWSAPSSRSPKSSGNCKTPSSGERSIGASC